MSDTKSNAGGADTVFSLISARALLNFFCKLGEAPIREERLLERGAYKNIFEMVMLTVNKESLFIIKE